jgi:hypothetical protein
LLVLTSLSERVPRVDPRAPAVSIRRTSLGK